ncbi:MAG: hypothetical protein ACE5FK_00510, partial [Candidatus Methylomirabilia bacterium]
EAGDQTKRLDNRSFHISISHAPGGVLTGRGRPAVTRAGSAGTGTGGPAEEEEYCARLPDFTSEDFPMHRVNLGAGIVIREGLTNLRALPPRRVPFYAPFYKIAGTEGALARFFATIG